MSWRLASRLSVVTFAILVVVLVTILQQHKINSASTGTTTTTTANTAGSAASSLQGTDLGNTPASDFRLTDQYGKSVALSQFRGKPVVLTFLYTNCPDQCPLTAEKLHTTVQDLGPAAQNIGVIAVSTDPARDNVAAALKFSQEHNMQSYWHYLIGPRTELAPIWSAYHIYAQPQQQTVNHSLGLFLIDKQGHQRIFLDDSFAPTVLANDLQILMKE
jgi:protein SCO1/2